MSTPAFRKSRARSLHGCPECLVRMELFDSAGDKVDKCPKCQGIWFDRNELGRFMDRLRELSLEKVIPLPAEGDATSYSIPSCPCCRTLLTEYEYQHRSKVRLHRCARCSGNWVSGSNLACLVRMAKVTQSIAGDVQGIAKEMRQQEQELESIRDMGRYASPFGVPRDFKWLLFLVVGELPTGVEGMKAGRWYVTGALIVANLGAFAASIATSLSRAVHRFALVPEHVASGRDYSTIWTSAFIHLDALHLLGNLWFLWLFGSHVENYLGHARYAALYAASILGAGLLTVEQDPLEGALLDLSRYDSRGATVSSN